MKKVVLFLDFDGVFHPLINAPLFFQDLPAFEKIIRDNMSNFNFKIVISSTWRNRKSMSDLKSIFSPDIALLVNDITPNLGKTGDGHRYQEALHWLAINDMSAHWIALDDDNYAWDNVSNLVWCHDKFQEREIDLFQEKLNSISLMSR